MERQIKEYIVKIHEERTGNIDSGWNNWGGVANDSFTTIVDVSHGGPIERYRDRIRSGLQATTPLQVSGSKATIVNSGSALTKHLLGDGPYEIWTEHRGCLSYVDNAVQDPSAFFILSVKNQVRMDIISKIREAHSKLKGLVALGEIGETVRMVNGAGRGLYQGVRSYLANVIDITGARRAKSPRDLARIIGERWLEWSFGWKPLISDIDDGMAAIERLKWRRLPYVRVASARESMEKTPLDPVLKSIAYYDVRIQPILLKRYGYKIYGLVGVANNPTGSLAHTFGFKLDEFIPTLWELIPYSFLVDYFINIGAVIDAVSLNKSSIRWLNEGELRSSELETETSFKHAPLADPWKVTESSFSLGTPYRSSRFIKYRNGLPSYSYLIPELEFKIPGSSTRWANIAALASLNRSALRQTRNYRG